MLLKIFSRGKGSGNAPINYLLGNDYMSEGKLRAGARIVSGNPLVTQAMINSSNFARRYTAGVLSFEEAPDAISKADKQAIIQDFEKAMFAGMAHDRYNVLWVEHTDKLNPKTGKPRLELNFLIPNTELYTGKRLQPYYHGQDAKYFRAWQFSYSVSCYKPNAVRQMPIWRSDSFGLFGVLGCPQASITIPHFSDSLKRGISVYWLYQIKLRCM